MTSSISQATVAELFKSVEADVNNKRFLKDPFKEEYIEVLHMPMEESVIQQGGNKNHYRIRDELDARSRDVRLRVELITKQIEMLYRQSEQALLTKKLSKTRSTKPPINESVGAESENENDDGSNIRQVLTSRQLLNAQNIWNKLSNESLSPEEGRRLDVFPTGNWKPIYRKADLHRLENFESQFSAMTHQSAIQKESHLTIPNQQMLLEHILDTQEEKGGDEVTTNVQNLRKCIQPFIIEDDSDSESTVSSDSSLFEEILSPKSATSQPSTVIVVSPLKKPQQQLEHSQEEEQDSIEDSEEGDSEPHCKKQRTDEEASPVTSDYKTVTLSQIQAHYKSFLNNNTGGPLSKQPQYNASCQPLKSHPEKNRHTLEYFRKKTAAFNKESRDALRSSIVSPHANSVFDPLISMDSLLSLNAMGDNSTQSLIFPDFNIVNAKRFLVMTKDWYGHQLSSDYCCNGSDLTNPPSSEQIEATQAAPATTDTENEDVENDDDLVDGAMESLSNLVLSEIQSCLKTTCICYFSNMLKSVKSTVSHQRLFVALVFTISKIHKKGTHKIILRRIEQDDGDIEVSVVAPLQ